MRADAQRHSWWFPLAAIAIMTVLAAAVLLVMYREDDPHRRIATPNVYVVSIAAAVLLVAALALGWWRIGHGRDDVELQPTFTAALVYAVALVAATMVFGPLWLLVPQVTALAGLVAAWRSSGAAMRSAKSGVHGNGSAARGGRRVDHPVQVGLPSQSDRPSVDLLAVMKGFLAMIAAGFVVGGWAILVGFAVIAYEKRRHRAGYA
jgi:hypothetical protein